MYVHRCVCAVSFFGSVFFFSFSVSYISFDWAAPVELNAKICEHRVAHPTVSLLGFVHLYWRRRRHCHCHCRCSCRCSCCCCVLYLYLLFSLVEDCITCCYRFVFILAAREPNRILFASPEKWCKRRKIQIRNLNGCHRQRRRRHQRCQWRERRKATWKKEHKETLKLHHEILCFAQQLKEEEL